MTLLGMGAMASPRYRPAGLLVEYAAARVMLDGGPRSAPAGRLDAWLVTDERGELMPGIRKLAKRKKIEPKVSRFERGGLEITPRRVVHTSHPAFGYLIRSPRKTAVWAPEFYRFPRCARGADLMFADAAGWSRPIRFAGSVGGHAAALHVAQRARRAGVRRLVFAHVGRPTLRALDKGKAFPFGELGKENHVY
jgi:ribonuclease BN (tRNA processing enzyme)